MFAKLALTLVAGLALYGLALIVIMAVLLWCGREPASDDDPYALDV